MYNKEIQTASVETDTSPDEEFIRQRILREKEDELEAERVAQRDKDLEEESVQLDREIEQELRGMLLSTLRCR
jgi:dynein intermediate chain, cytosolic